jgi:tartrate dehydratase beta subunit/fumarate hydratase class I family protein
LKDDVKTICLGDKIMLIGHVLNGIAVALLSVGSILREGEEIPTKLREGSRNWNKGETYLD